MQFNIAAGSNLNEMIFFGFENLTVKANWSSIFHIMFKNFSLYPKLHFPLHYMKIVLLSSNGTNAWH